MVMMNIYYGFKTILLHYPVVLQHNESWQRMKRDERSEVKPPCTYTTDFVRVAWTKHMENKAYKFGSTITTPPWGLPEVPQLA